MTAKTLATLLFAAALAGAPALAATADAAQQGGVRRPPAGGGGGHGGGSGSGGGAVRRAPPPPPPSSGGDHARPARPSRPANDHAIPRSEAPSRPHRPIVIVRPNPWGWYYDPWWYSGFGIGYSYYSPWAWYGPGWGYHYPAATYAYDGKVRLKVKPRDAEVYVDNYYAGTVDDFDGTFQGLRLMPGGHKIEVRKPGYETLTYDVHVQPDRTITFRGEMQPTP